MIIFENNYTLQGFKGTQDIFTQDAFTGYFGKDKNLVTGGRYRPLSQFTFMIEYELFGQSIHDKVGLNRAPQNEELFSESPLPIISHAVNVLLFIILCLITYHVLRKIFPNYDHKKWYLSLPFIATLLFALHPLHTEAVANIKGRDEIMCMLGAMFAVFSTIKYMNKRNILWLFAAFAAMVFALFSKENAITFLAIIPLVVYFLPNTKKKIGLFDHVNPYRLGKCRLPNCAQSSVGRNTQSKRNTTYSQQSVCSIHENPRNSHRFDHMGYLFEIDGVPLPAYQR